MATFGLNATGAARQLERYRAARARKVPWHRPTWSFGPATFGVPFQSLLTSRDRHPEHRPASDAADSAAAAAHQARFDESPSRADDEPRRRRSRRPVRRRWPWRRPDGRTRML